MFEVLQRHRNVAPLLVDGLPTGPNSLAQREWMIATLLDNGFPSALAARSCATVARYVLGFAIQPGTSGDDDEADFSHVLHNLDRNAFPATTAVADHLPVPLEEEFAFGLELIIDALGRELQRHRRRNKT